MSPISWHHYWATRSPKARNINRVQYYLDRECTELADSVQSPDLTTAQRLKIIQRLEELSTDRSFHLAVPQTLRLLYAPDTFERGESYSPYALCQTLLFATNAHGCNIDEFYSFDKSIPTAIRDNISFLTGSQAYREQVLAQRSAINSPTRAFPISINNPYGEHQTAMRTAITFSIVIKGSPQAALTLMSIPTDARGALIIALSELGMNGTLLAKAIRQSLVFDRDNGKHLHPNFISPGHEDISEKEFYGGSSAEYFRAAAIDLSGLVTSSELPEVELGREIGLVRDAPRRRAHLRDALVKNATVRTPELRIRETFSSQQKEEQRIERELTEARARLRSNSEQIFEYWRQRLSSLPDTEMLHPEEYALTIKALLGTYADDVSLSARSRLLLKEPVGSRNDYSFRNDEDLLAFVKNSGNRKIFDWVGFFVPTGSDQEIKNNMRNWEGLTRTTVYTYLKMLGVPEEELDIFMAKAVADRTTETQNVKDLLSRLRFMYRKRQTEIAINGNTESSSLSIRILSKEYQETINRVILEGKPKPNIRAELSALTIKDVAIIVAFGATLISALGAFLYATSEGQEIHRRLLQQFPGSAEQRPLGDLFLPEIVRLQMPFLYAKAIGTHIPPFMVTDILDNDTNAVYATAPEIEVITDTAEVTLTDGERAYKIYPENIGSEIFPPTGTRIKRIHTNNPDFRVVPNIEGGFFVKAGAESEIILVLEDLEITDLSALDNSKTGMLLKVESTTGAYMPKFDLQAALEFAEEIKQNPALYAAYTNAIDNLSDLNYETPSESDFRIADEVLQNLLIAIGRDMYTRSYSLDSETNGTVADYVSKPDAKFYCNVAYDITRDYIESLGFVGFGYLGYPTNYLEGYIWARVSHVFLGAASPVGKYVYYADNTPHAGANTPQSTIDALDPSLDIPGQEAINNARNRKDWERNNNLPIVLGIGVLAAGVLGAIAKLNKRNSPEQAQEVKKLYHAISNNEGKSRSKIVTMARIAVINLAISKGFGLEVQEATELLDEAQVMVQNRTTGLLYELYNKFEKSADLPSDIEQAHDYILKLLAEGYFQNEGGLRTITPATWTFIEEAAKNLNNGTMAQVETSAEFKVMIRLLVNLKSALRSRAQEVLVGDATDAALRLRQISEELSSESGSLDDKAELFARMSRVLNESLT